MTADPQYFIKVRGGPDTINGETTLQTLLDAYFGSTSGMAVLRSVAGWSASAPVSTATMDAGLGATLGLVPQRGSSAWAGSTLPAPSVVMFWPKAGAVSVATDVAPWYICPRQCSGIRAFATAKTAPVGAAMIFDIMRSTDFGGSWASIWVTNPGNRLTIADGSKNGNTIAIDTIGPYDATDIFRLDVIQVGSGTAGSDITVEFFCF